MVAKEAGHVEATSYPLRRPDKDCLFAPALLELRKVPETTGRRSKFNRSATANKHLALTLRGRYNGTPLRRISCRTFLVTAFQ